MITILEWINQGLEQGLHQMVVPNSPGWRPWRIHPKSNQPSCGTEQSFQQLWRHAEKTGVHACFVELHMHTSAMYIICYVAMHNYPNLYAPTKSHSECIELYSLWCNIKEFKIVHILRLATHLCGTPCTTTDCSPPLADASWNPPHTQTHCGEVWFVIVLHGQSTVWWGTRNRISYSTLTRSVRSSTVHVQQLRLLH